MIYFFNTICTYNETSVLNMTKKIIKGFKYLYKIRRSRKISEQNLRTKELY